MNYMCEVVLNVETLFMTNLIQIEFTLEFIRKLESTQYTATLAVIGAWRGTNMNKLYEELGWEYQYRRRWYRRSTHSN